MSLRVFAFGCHPDDIEFMMSGALFLLKEQGAEVHYMNPANGCLGTATHDREEIIRIRRDESMRAAAYLGAVYHESIADDLQVTFSQELIRKTAAIVREIKPDIMLILSLEDYMDDHMNSSRLGYTAAFCRGMKNLTTDPPMNPINQDIAVYHALPYGLKDMLNRPIKPDIFIDVRSVMEKKETMLAMHESQNSWLDESQGLSAYMETMKQMCGEVGGMSGRFQFAEGFRRHNHLGFCKPDARPLETALKDYYLEIENN